LMSSSIHSASLPDTVSSSQSAPSSDKRPQNVANRKLDEFIMSPSSTQNHHKEDLWNTLLTTPVQRLIPIKSLHKRCQSYDLHASEHGCLA
jgi:hypothetical protein